MQNYKQKIIHIKNNRQQITNQQNELGIKKQEIRNKKQEIRNKRQEIRDKRQEIRDKRQEIRDKELGIRNQEIRNKKKEIGNKKQKVRNTRYEIRDIEEIDQKWVERRQVICYKHCETMPACSQYHLRKVENVRSKETEVRCRDLPPPSPVGYPLQALPPKVRVSGTSQQQGIDKIRIPLPSQPLPKKSTPGTNKIIGHTLRKSEVIRNSISDCRNTTSDYAKPLRNSHSQTKQPLYFKSSSEENSSGLLSTIQQFWKKITNSEEGCACSQSCQWALKYIKWVNNRMDIFQVFYEQIQTKVQSYNQNNLPQEKQTRMTKTQTRTSGWTYKRKINREIEERDERERIKTYWRDVSQIEKDVRRTHINYSCFQTEKFQGMLRRILLSYATEDPNVGYVQGMNYILSPLLYHIKDEVKSFAVFWQLMQRIRGIFLEDFKEGYIRVKQVEHLLQLHVCDLHVHFQNLGIDLTLLCLPWFISFMGSLIPLKYMHLVYAGFINLGWTFINRLCLSIFVYHKAALLTAEDMCEVFSLLSPSNEKQQSYEWSQIVSYANDLLV